MTQEERQNLINTLIIDNNTMQVSPAKIRQVLLALNESITITEASAVTALTPLNYNAFTNVMSIQKSDATHSGYLSAEDWVLFSASTPSTDATTTTKGVIKLAGHLSGTADSPSVPWISTNGANILSHLSNTSNPHSVTKSQIGLGNVDNTSDVNKPISTATQTALNAKLSGTLTTNRIPKANGSGVLSDSGLIQVGGNIGLGSAVVPGELFHIGDGNILLEGGGEVAQKFKRDFSTTGENLGVPTGSGVSVNPIFQIGRIIQAGDGDPEIRIMYSDDNTTERTVFEVDRKGIVASVKTAIGSHYEGFASLTDVNPMFRLNSYPRMRLEMGAGGNNITDVAVERGASGELAFFTNSTKRGEFDSSGNLSIITAPTTSASTYDILTRNTSTGKVEKVVSTGFGDMLLGSTQTVSALKTYLNGTLGLRNVANTFTSLFTNTNTAARTYTLQDRNGTLLDSTDLSTINTSLGTKQSVFTGTTNYLPKSINSTTLGVSRIIDNGNYIGIGTANTPTKDFTLGNQANREIGIEESSNTIVGRDLVVTAGRTVNYALNTNFNPLSQASRGWTGIGGAPNGNVYATVRGSEIYMQTAGTGNFNALGQAGRQWRGIDGHTNGNIYAVDDGGDIYMQTAGTGNFNALSQTSRAWYDVASNPNGNVYACVYNGDIYVQTAGTGNFNALGGTSRAWRAITVNSNGNVYAVAQSGDIYMQTSSSGAFNGLGQTSRNWIGITASNGNIYAVVEGGGMYIQTAGTGNFVLSNQPSVNWQGIGTSSNNNVYATAFGGDIYMQDNYAIGTSNLSGGTLKLKAGTGKGTGQSRIQFVTGAKTSSGTDMQIETVRAEIDEQGVFKLNSIPTYADNTTALAGGLTAGMFYRTAVGILMIVY